MAGQGCVEERAGGLMRADECEFGYTAAVRCLCSQRDKIGWRRDWLAAPAPSPFLLPATHPACKPFPTSLQAPPSGRRPMAACSSLMAGPASARCACWAAYHAACRGALEPRNVLPMLNCGCCLSAPRLSLQYGTQSTAHDKTKGLAHLLLTPVALLVFHRLQLIKKGLAHEWSNPKKVSLTAQVHS